MLPSLYNIESTPSAENIVLVDVDVECADWHGNSDFGNADQLQAFASAILTEANRYCRQEKAIPQVQNVEISVLFCDDAHMKKLNAHYRGKDKTTNVLSFCTSFVPVAAEQVLLLGDIVLAYGCIYNEATRAKRGFKNHLGHLLVHGFLHLHGYLHDTDQHADIMQSHEIAILHGLGIANPYQIPI